MNIEEQISLIELSTGEKLLGLCVGFTELAINFAFPYVVTETSIKPYISNLSQNRYFVFAMKDIIYFKDVNDETKTKFKQLVLAEEQEEYESFIDSSKEIEMPKDSFFIAGNSTIH